MRFKTTSKDRSNNQTSHHWTEAQGKWVDLAFYLFTKPCSDISLLRAKIYIIFRGEVEKWLSFLYYFLIQLSYNTTKWSYMYIRLHTLTNRHNSLYRHIFVSMGMTLHWPYTTLQFHRHNFYLIDMTLYLNGHIIFHNFLFKLIIKFWFIKTFQVSFPPKWTKYETSAIVGFLLSCDFGISYKHDKENVEVNA